MLIFGKQLNGLMKTKEHENSKVMFYNMKITGKDVAALLHGIHRHDEKTEEIIYREKDILPVLKALGLPDPKWELSMSVKQWKKYKKKNK